MSVITDYPDNAPHVATASQIAETGVPLLTASSVITGPGTFAIAGGGSKTYAVSNLAQIGYEALVTASFPAAATVPFIEVSLAWRDSVTNARMWSDSFIVPGATSPAFWVTRGRGQSKADQLIVTVTNLDPAQTVTYNLTVFQNSRIPPTDIWQWDNNSDNGSAIPGFSLPKLPDDESVLGILDGVTIAASQQNTYLFGMWDGLVNIGYEVNTGTASNLTIKIRPAPDGQYSTHNIIYSATGPPSNFQVAGNRAPLRVIVANAATTAMVMSLSAIRAG